MKLFHGLGAYNGGKSKDLMVSKISSLISNEIAIADKPIGSFGVFVDGTILEAYQGDCWSLFDNTGKRYATKIVETKQDISSIEEYVLFALECFENNSWKIKDYCEGFLKCLHIEGIWVKSNASKQQIKAAKDLAFKMNMKCTVIDYSSRSWDF